MKGFLQSPVFFIIGFCLCLDLFLELLAAFVPFRAVWHNSVSFWLRFLRKWVCKVMLRACVSVAARPAFLQCSWHLLLLHQI